MSEGKTKTLWMSSRFAVQVSPWMFAFGVSYEWEDYLFILVGPFTFLIRTGRG